MFFNTVILSLEKQSELGEKGRSRAAGDGNVCLVLDCFGRSR